MRMLVVAVLAIFLAGCAGAKKRGVRATDSFEAVQIDQMEGNAVSGQVFERTLLCLNARREARSPRPVTNVVITFSTNVSVSFVTNQSITLSTNQSRTLATNSAPPPPTVAKETATTAATNEITAAQTNSTTGSASPVVQETNSPPVAVATPPATNDSATTSSNVSVSKSANQTSATSVTQLASSHQVTITTNNLSLTTADNEVVSLETNAVVVAITNQTVLPHTNVTITTPQDPQYDYFLYTEFTPAPDFTAVTTGESLVLLVDGVRHGLASTNLQTGFVTRRGFATTFYRAPPQLIEDIANAKEVQIRLRGVNGVIEKKMNRASRANFKQFLSKFADPAETNSNRTADAHPASPPPS